MKTRNNAPTPMQKGSVAWLDWVEDHYSAGWQWGLWFLFMGGWFAYHAWKTPLREGWETEIVVLGGRGTLATMSFLWVCLTVAASLLIGTLLLLSCLAIRFDWRKSA